MGFRSWPWKNSFRNRSTSSQRASLLSKTVTCWSCWGPTRPWKKSDPRKSNSVRLLTGFLYDPLISSSDCHNKVSIGTRAHEWSRDRNDKIQRIKCQVKPKIIMTIWMFGWMAAGCCRSIPLALGSWHSFGIWISAFDFMQCFFGRYLWEPLWRNEWSWDFGAAENPLEKGNPGSGSLLSPKVFLV